MGRHRGFQVCCPMQIKLNMFYIFHLADTDMVQHVWQFLQKAAFGIHDFCLFVCLTAHQHKEVIRANTRCGCSLTSYPGRLAFMNTFSTFASVYDLQSFLRKKRFRALLCTYLLILIMSQDRGTGCLLICAT
jgi:hypothetical protein